MRCFGTVAILTLLAFGASAQEPEMKLTRAEALEAVVSKVQPEYPTIATQLKIEGDVDLAAVVGENGAVEKVNILSGNPILTRPAADALKRWKFKPFTADGKPVKALAPVTIHFKRTQ